MHSNLRFAHLAIGVLLIAGGASEAAAADLVVEVSGLKNTLGDLRIGLFDSEDGFLKEEAIAIGVRVKWWLRQHLGHLAQSAPLEDLTLNPRSSRSF